MEQGARAVAPLRILLLLLNQLPQAVGRAQRGTSTLGLCQRHLGPCPFPLQPRARARGTRPWRKPVPAPGCCPAPMDRGFLVLCSPSPGVALPGPMLYLGPAAAGPPRLSPRCSPLPGQGSTGGLRSRLYVCVRVAPGPEGPLYRDALPAGLCTYCKKQLFESCCFGFCFLSPFPLIPLYPVGKEALTGLGPGWGAGSTAAPACSCCSTHFSSTLHCLCKETGQRGPARSLGMGQAMPSSGSTHLVPVTEPPAAAGLGTRGVRVTGGAPHPTCGGPSHWLLLPPASAGPAELGSRHGQGPPAAPGAQRRASRLGRGVPQALLAVEEGWGGWGVLLPTFPVGTQLNLPLGVK